MKNKQLDRLFIFLDFKCYGRRNQFAMATPFPNYKDISGGFLHGLANGMETQRKRAQDEEARVQAKKQAKFERWLKEVIASKRHWCVCGSDAFSITVTTMGRAASGQWDETTSLRLMIRDMLDDELPKSGEPIEITPEGWKVWRK